MERTKPFLQKIWRDDTPKSRPVKHRCSPTLPVHDASLQRRAVRIRNASHLSAVNVRRFYRWRRLNVPARQTFPGGNHLAAHPTAILPGQKRNEPHKVMPFAVFELRQVAQSPRTLRFLVFSRNSVASDSKATAFTVIRRSRSSFASTRTSPSTPAFDAT